MNLKKYDNKKVRFKDSGNNIIEGISEYYTKEMNPCRCGSNCQHYEYDGKNVFVVCNGCWSDLAIIKPEYAEEYLNKGIWRNMAEVYGTGTD